MFGDSIVHGVGGVAGGWADKLKATMNGQLSAPDGSGFTLYELGVPGDTARDILRRLEVELIERVSSKKPQETYIIFGIGTNDSKAITKPDNFMFGADDYAANVQACIGIARQYTTHILCVGLTPVDISKTNPRQSPLTGNNSYFSNQRIEKFEAALERVCKIEKIPFVPLFAKVPADWRGTYLSIDGLHPGDAGHEWIFEQVQPQLAKLLKGKKS